MNNIITLKDIVYCISNQVNSQISNKVYKLDLQIANLFWHMMKTDNQIQIKHKIEERIRFEIWHQVRMQVRNHLLVHNVSD
jgi:hypothetical protein